MVDPSKGDTEKGDGGVASGASKGAGRAVTKGGQGGQQAHGQEQTGPGTRGSRTAIRRKKEMMHR